jgi:hypothetical protein
MLSKKKTKHNFWSKLAPIWQQMKANWFTYSLMLIILIAIYKKHQVRIESAMPIGSKQSKAIVQQELGLVSGGQADFSMEQQQAFMLRFRATAHKESLKFGIPENVILATALVQSRAGIHPACQQNQNYFLIRNGKSVASFQTPWESFRAFSKAIIAEKGSKKVKSYADWVRLIAESDVLLLQPGFADEMLALAP